MTDQFEKWLEKEERKRAWFVNKIDRPNQKCDIGRYNEVTYILAKYREFLKEQSEKAAPYDITKFYPKPKESPLIFWDEVYHKWDETKKRFIPQFVARRLK